MIVMKFGGSSLQSAEAIQQVIEIIRTRMAQEPVVVVSALGKVTDNLLALGTEAAAGQRQRWTERLAGLKTYHAGIAAKLVPDVDGRIWSDFLERHFTELQVVIDRLNGCGHISPVLQDAVTSFGERLSSGLIAMALQSSGIRSIHLDARELICTDNRHTHATPFLDETYRRVRNAVERLPQGTVPVLGGFIATGVNGATTTLGRNSSNLTAVLVAASVGADRVEMWTDVDGVFRRDPRHVQDQFPVEEMSFTEAQEIARNGARVLHLEAVRLACEENIAIHIKNSSRPELPGTRVSGLPAVESRSTVNNYLGAASSD
jgi:aspartate kinase